MFQGLAEAFIVDLTFSRYAGILLLDRGSSSIFEAVIDP